MTKCDFDGEHPIKPTFHSELFGFRIDLLAIVLFVFGVLLPDWLRSGLAVEPLVSESAVAAVSGVPILGESVVYKEVDGRKLRLFVERPADWKAADRRPATVFYHGGGWEKGRGNASQFNFQARYFAARGMVAFKVEFRLIEDNRREAPITPSRDAKSAMRYIRTHAAEFGIDPDRVASAGGSAGGHLAAFVGMVEGTDEPTDDLSVSCKSNAMVLYNPALLQPGITDTMKSEKRKKSSVASALIADYEKLSPYLQVSSDDPPGVILVGTEDGILPIEVVNKFLERCRAAGVAIEAEIYPGEGHSFFGLSDSFDRFLETTQRADRFLGSLGWLQGEPTITKKDVEAFAAEHIRIASKKK